MPSVLNLVDLGSRIRASRLARRMTLEDVVSRTDFTVSWLSKVENGQLAPSLEGLVRLAGVLECGVDHLGGGLAVAPRMVVDRKGQGWVSSGGDGQPGPRVEELATAWRERAMIPAILHLSAATPRQSLDHFDGERFLHVLAGDVSLAYGDEAVPLAAGDSVYFDASLPHTLTVDGRGSARVLSMLFEPDRVGETSRSGRRSRPRPDGRGRANGQAAKRA